MKETSRWIVGAFLVVPALLFLESYAAAAMEQKAGVAGPNRCGECHEQIMKDVGKTSMGRLFLKHPRNSAEEMACEACHGPGETHAESGGSEFGGMVRFLKNTPNPVRERNGACLRCHQKQKLLFWEGSPHERRDLACTQCHKAHTQPQDISNRSLLSRPKALDVCAECHRPQEAQQMRFSHHPLREGKMDCSSCHNPHGTPSEKLVNANSLNDLCYRCHMEKRGPFLFEHPPVMEDCSNCHYSHGSNYPRLMKVPELRICRQCHINFHALNAAGVSPGHVAGRICTDCHFNIHGSNYPTEQGRWFLR
jgi:DmsE family decaheme c-type cytochrome